MGSSTMAAYFIDAESPVKFGLPAYINQENRFTVMSPESGRVYFEELTLDPEALHHKGGVG